MHKVPVARPGEILVGFLGLYSPGTQRRCIVGPDIPNNAGSLGVVRITAPVNSILNAIHPAPVVSPPPPTGAAGDAIFMKYGNIMGDVTTNGAKGEIEVNSWQFGIGRGISSPTGGSSDRESTARAAV